MKFLPTLASALIVCFVFQFLFGSLLYNFIWLRPVIYAIVLTAAVYFYVKLDDKITALERRITELEEKEES